MQNKPYDKSVNIRLKFLFWSTALAIPLISFTGRHLQHWLEASLTKEKTGWLVVFLLLITALVYIVKFTKNWKSLWWRLLVILIILITILEFIPISEERIHFILFGSLGYLGTMLFAPLKGLLFCFFFSVGDELFQWFLPDRVGDIRDVIFNFIASSIGIILALSERNAD